MKPSVFFSNVEKKIFPRNVLVTSSMIKCISLRTKKQEEISAHCPQPDIEAFLKEHLNLFHEYEQTSKKKTLKDYLIENYLIKRYKSSDTLKFLYFSVWMGIFIKKIFFDSDFEFGDKDNVIMINLHH